MRTSESIDKVSAAIVKAQSEFKPVKLDSVNPHFRSKYASYDSVWASIKEALKANGLGVLLPIGKAEHGIKVTPFILHTSGQFIEGDEAVFPVDKANAQGVVSASTYARRAALTAFLGIAGDADDDGNAAVGGSEAKAKSAAASLKAKAASGDFDL